jgi:hypothetical protein
MPGRKNDYEKESRGRSRYCHHAGNAYIRSYRCQLSEYARSSSGNPRGREETKRSCDLVACAQSPSCKACEAKSDETRP